MSLRCFRLNCAPQHIPIAEALLRAQGYEFEPEAFCPTARGLLAEPRSLGNSLAAQFGLIYIQDRASMLPPVALNPPPGAAVLDMCASPGSKTSQLAHMVGAEGLVLGNEPSPSRLATLRRNLHSLGLCQSVTCCHGAENLPLAPGMWPYIQLDPPCSGWGTVEKNPQVTRIWKEEKIDPLVHLQRQLLRKATELLQPGGVVVYSTCTTNEAENQQQALFAMEELGLLPEALPALPGFDLDCLANVDPQLAQAMWSLRPKSGENQGFFVARFRKPGILASHILPPLPEEERLSYQTYAQDFGPLAGQVGIFGESLHFVHKQAELSLPPALRWQGLYLGKSSGQRLAPLSRLMPPNCPSLNLQGQDGITKLLALMQGQSLPCQVEGKAKDMLLVWENLPLGWVRIKNQRLLWSER